MQPITFEQFESIVIQLIESANEEFQGTIERATENKRDWGFVNFHAEIKTNELNGLKSFIFQLYLKCILEKSEYDGLAEKIEKVRDALFKQSMDYRQPL